MVPKYALILVGCPRCKTAFVSLTLDAGDLKNTMCDRCFVFRVYLDRMESLTGRRQISAVWEKGEDGCLSLRRLSGKETIVFQDEESKKDTSSEDTPI